VLVFLDILILWNY